MRSLSYLKAKSLIFLISSSLLTAYCQKHNASNTPKGVIQVNSKKHVNYVATKKELDWLKVSCLKVKTVQAESGFEDLLALKRKIGNARIVALGENTHGTSEVFKMKHRLIEFLSTEMGFSILSVEIGMPEAYKLNDYVLNGNGNPSEIIREWGFPLNNQEVLDLIEWMRKFNATGKGRIQFTGFDMQFIEGAMDNIFKFAKANDHELESKLDTITNLVEQLKSEGSQFLENKKALENIKHKCENVFSYLTLNKESISKTLNESEYNWLVQNSNIIVQSVGAAINHDDISYRDKCMAENVGWILNNYPNEKVILWGHIGHLRKELPWMGGYLSEKFHSNYYSIGTVSNSGNYTAVYSNKLSTTNILNDSEPGSFEFSFHKIGIPIFYFDFNQVKENEPESVWLTTTLNYRGIGSEATDKQFFPTRLSELYNAIIFIDSTHASHCFSIY